MTNQKFPAFLAPTPTEWEEIVAFTKGASTTADAIQAAMMAWNLCVEKHYEWCKQEEEQRAALQSNKPVSKPKKRDNRYSYQSILRVLELDGGELADCLGVARTSIYKWLHSNKIPAKYNPQLEELIDAKIAEVGDWRE